jgi:hypothetical protein
MTTDYYDRDGKPISQDVWVEWLSNKDYKVIAHTVMSDGKHMVSTVWLGLNHNFIGKTPLIFETMVFAADEMSPVDGMQWRYSTEDQAMAGHLEAYNMLRSMYDNDRSLDPNESELGRFDRRIPIASSGNDGRLAERSTNVQGNVVRGIRSRQDSPRDDDSAGYNPTGKRYIIHRHRGGLGVVEQSPEPEDSDSEDEIPQP